MLAQGKLMVPICLSFSLGKYSRGLIISLILTTPLWHRKVVYTIRNNLGNRTLMNPFPTFFCWRAAPLVVLGDLCPWPRFLFLSPPLGCALGWTEFINPREEAVLPMEATCSLVNLYPAAASKRKSAKQQVQ